MSSTISPSFQAGGLASGLDSSSIIDGLVKLEQQPLDSLRRQQGALQSQVSIFGDIASRLAALRSAADALVTGGVLATRVTSSSTGFGAVTGSGAVAGTYGVQVDQLAAAAKARSTGLADGSTLAGGKLQLSLDAGAQTFTTAEWKDGATLDDVASAIRASGAPVTALVLNDGTSSWLSVTRSDTGFAPGTDATRALQLTFTQTGTTGQALAFSPTQDAKNALFEVEGVHLERTSNVVTDAIPGTTITLQARTSAPEELIVQNDAAATQAKVQTYVDAYNAVSALVQREMSPAQNTARSTTLTGDSSIRSLQQTLQALSSRVVPGLGGVQSLADLGVKTNRDGTLSIDAATLSAAIQRNPGAVEALFSTASTGVGALVDAAVDQYTQPSTGILVSAQSALQDRIKAMDDQATEMQDRLDSYREGLVAQFTAMETVVSQMKSIGSFLAAQSQSQQSK